MISFVSERTRALITQGFAWFFPSTDDEPQAGSCAVAFDISTRPQAPTLETSNPVSEYQSLFKALEAVHFFYATLFDCAQRVLGRRRRGRMHPSTGETA